MRIGYNGTLVLAALAKGARYGFEIMARTGLRSGTVYPLLRRYEAATLVTSDWEDDADSAGQGRPRRRYYTITPAGAESLDEATERLHAHRALLAPASTTGTGK